MRIFTIFVISCLMGLMSLAQASTLKDNMKSADKLVKQIKLTAADPAHNSENASVAGSIVPFFEAALNQVPEFVQTLPESQKPAALQEYQGMIQHVIQSLTELQNAFASNDNASAQTILKKLADQKNEGHDRFDP